MSTIPAIETPYKGYRFRSRTEAKWAVFLDHAGVPWKYEPDGYVVDGVPYLPDFLLYPDTEIQAWLEIKGKYPDRGEIDKARGLAKLTGIQTYLYFGPIEPPGPGLSRIRKWDDFFEPAGSTPQWHNEHGWIMNGTEAYAWEAGLTPTAFRFDAKTADREPRSGFWWWTECPVCGRVILKHHGMVGWCPTLPDLFGDGVPKDVDTSPVLAHETDRLLLAYAAARSARFEHGEQPAAPGTLPGVSRAGDLVASTTRHIRASRKDKS